MTGTGRRLEGRSALITGASRGIGAAVAMRFAAEGARTILTARTVGGLEEVDDVIRAAGGAAPTLVPLDLGEFDRIDALGGALNDRFGHLDVLVANAGLLGDLGPMAHLGPETWDAVMAVNVTANYRLIRSLDPLLRASPAGRAIFVTSGAAQAATAYWGVYAVSKAALEMMVRTYAAEVARTALRVNLLNPGPVRTGMRAQAFPGEDPATLPAPDQITEAFVALAEEACARHGEVVGPG
jgi:NAD(P)-dependent dehydrogenase (short-subunit alcohol dehydrogenase family)